MNDVFNWSDKTILIAEDTDTNYMLVEAILKKTNVKLQWVKDGGAVIDHLSSNDAPDLLLLDIRMPVMNGYEVLEKLQEQKFDRPVIALTAYAMREDTEKIKDAGFDDHIPKPFKLDSFYSVINKYLQ